MEKIYLKKDVEIKMSFMDALNFRGLCESPPGGSIYVKYLTSKPSKYSDIIYAVNGFKENGKYTINDSFFYAEIKSYRGLCYYEIVPSGVCLPFNWFDNHRYVVFNKLMTFLSKR
jgi:hypothetical protein